MTGLTGAYRWVCFDNVFGWTKGWVCMYQIRIVRCGYVCRVGGCSDRGGSFMISLMDHCTINVGKSLWLIRYRGTVA